MFPDPYIRIERRMAEIGIREYGISEVNLMVYPGSTRTIDLFNEYWFFSLFMSEADNSVIVSESSFHDLTAGKFTWQDKTAGWEHRRQLTITNYGTPDTYTVNNRFLVGTLIAPVNYSTVVIQMALQQPLLNSEDISVTIQPEGLSQSNILISTPFNTVVWTPASFDLQVTVDISPPGDLQLDFLFTGDITAHFVHTAKFPALVAGNNITIQYAIPGGLLNLNLEFDNASTSETGSQTCSFSGQSNSNPDEFLFFRAVPRG
jgi:hypothetical protein